MQKRNGQGPYATLLYHHLPEGSVADLLLKHPRIFEYKVEEGKPYLVKGKARIQVGGAGRRGSVFA